jgi:dephospho-CoA kinase
MEEARQFLYTLKCAVSLPRTMIIGITGSIGSGKTAAAKIFSSYHFTRIDADEIRHGLIKKDSAAYKKIIKTFGSKILDKHQNIDWKKFGDIIFNDWKKLKKLNYEQILYNFEV